MLKKTTCTKTIEYRKKGDGNGVIGKEEKREAKEKIFRCSEGRYGESWCKGIGRFGET